MRLVYQPNKGWFYKLTWNQGCAVKVGASVHRIDDWRTVLFGPYSSVAAILKAGWDRSVDQVEGVVYRRD